MCRHGDTVRMLVTIDASVSHSGKEEFRYKPIDRCIATIVQALEDGDVVMTGSCCGHGKGPGEILLADGRVLTIHEGADAVHAG